MGNLSYELKVDVDINTYMHAFVIHTVTHVACTASISDLLYKPIKAGNILYYPNHVIFCYFFTIIFAEKYNGIHHHIIKFYIPVIKVSLSNSGIRKSSTPGFLSQQ